MKVNILKRYPRESADETVNVLLRLLSKQVCLDLKQFLQKMQEEQLLQISGATQCFNTAIICYKLISVRLC